VNGVSSQSVLTVSNLTKFYGDFKALDSVSFAVEKGWIYGYLGPNGAGKTTTIRTILGLLKPDQGEVQISGVNPNKDPVQALQSLGYAPELPNLQTFFTGEQLLDFVGKMFGLATQVRKERIKQLLDLGYVSKRYPLRSRKPNTRVIHYALDDALLRFWFRSMSLAVLCVHSFEGGLRLQIKPIQ